jgi:uncharacterized damage-inducible protein DinB
MTAGADILVDAITRVKETSARAAKGLTPELLEARVDPEANTIGWLLWHIGRVQDAQVSDVAGTEQLWTSAGWMGRFALPFAASETGYAHSVEEVGQVKGVTADLFVDYIAAVCDRTIEYLGTLSDADLDRVVDTRWTPAVTLAARLVSVVSDDLQHAGQAAFIRGVVERTSA